MTKSLSELDADSTNGDILSAAPGRRGECVVIACLSAAE